MKDYLHIVREIFWIFCGALFYLFGFVVLFALAMLTYNRVLGAPRPMVKAKPVPTITAGEWVLVWSGSKGPMTLHENGAYECMFCGQKWEGSWGWDAKTRTFHVHEHVNDSSSWLYWTLEVKDELKGEGKIYQTATETEVQRTIPIALEKPKKTSSSD